ncbi:hypothetical protein WJX73_008112 [Symbiochloris irregularis]|uniref:Uncharacterized protein n=1 Tax=Symbiochloris irregularis TaxID=706552 RepID=A0AAW1P2V6_9CHLO
MSTKPVRAKLVAAGSGSLICSLQVSDSTFKMQRATSDVLLECDTLRISGLQRSVDTGHVSIQVKLGDANFGTISVQALTGSGRPALFLLADELFQRHKQAQTGAITLGNTTALVISEALSKSSASLAGADIAEPYLVSSNEAMGFASFEEQAQPGNSLETSVCSKEQREGAAPSAESYTPPKADSAPATAAECVGLPFSATLPDQHHEQRTAALETVVTDLQQQLQAALSQLEAQRMVQEESEKANQASMGNLAGFAQSSNAGWLASQAEVQDLQAQLGTLEQANQQLQADNAANAEALQQAMELLVMQGSQLADMEDENSGLKEALGQTDHALAGLAESLELVVQAEASQAAMESAGQQHLVEEQQVPEQQQCSEETPASEQQLEEQRTPQVQDRMPTQGLMVPQSREPPDVLQAKQQESEYDADLSRTSSGIQMDQIAALHGAIAEARDAAELAKQSCATREELDQLTKTAIWAVIPSAA